MAGSWRNELSRTDKTTPLWVRHAEHDPQAGPRPPCRWEDPGALVFGHTCCPGCDDRSCRKEWQQMVGAGNRKERYAARREARRYAAGEYRD